MRFTLFASAMILSAILLAPSPAAAIKKSPYPEIKVEAPAPYKPDASLQAMRMSLADAIRRKNVGDLSALVAPAFFWTENGDSAEQFDKSRDGLHNFKVAFGFRQHGKSSDNQNSENQLWELLDDMASEQSLFLQDGDPNVVCGPAAAEPVDSEAMDQAIEKIEGEDEDTEWVYSLTEIILTESPGGSAVAKVASLAMPVVSTYPPTKATGNNPIPTHYELLLPFGKTAWTETKNVHPLAVDKLCYGKDSSGAWKIVGYDQNG
jgi:hypothetical protein